MLNLLSPTMYVFITCTAAVFIQSMVGNVQGNPDEFRLRENLLEQYHPASRPYTRPVQNDSDTVIVNMGVALVNLVELDEEREVATLHLWERHLWSDYTLSWDPAEYGGINMLRIPVSKIWTPDIVLYNSISNDNTPMEPERHDLAVVYHTGDVLYIPRFLRKVKCYRDGSNFHITLKYGSWTFDGNQVGLDFYEGLKEIDLSDYVMDNEYDLEENTAVINVKYYPCCMEPYPDLVFTTVFRKMKKQQ